MASVSRFSRFWSAFVAVGLATIGAAVSRPAPASAEPANTWPSEVRALYRIEFSGFDIGTFEFTSNVRGRAYALSGDARLSALLGAFTWQGVTHSSGALAGDAPHPAGYAFSFSGTGKQGSVRMGFAGNAVQSISHVPTYVPPPNVAPLKDAHLKGVLDPLSAVMALARSRSDNPCHRRLQIFDGKQRFDLELTFKRHDRLADGRPSGQPSIAYVCRVKYTPIAGHRANNETRAMAASQGIEVSLRPVPSANLFVPHQIVIPTIAGTVTMTAQRVQIITPRNEQIALGH